MILLPTWYQNNCFYSLLLRCRINDHCKPFLHCHLLILIQLFTLSSKIQGAMPQTERKIYSCSLIFENPQKRTNCFVWRKLTRKMDLSWSCIWLVKVKEGLICRLRNRKVSQNFLPVMSTQLSYLNFLSSCPRFVTIPVNLLYGCRESNWRNLFMGSGPRFVLPCCPLMFMHSTEASVFGKKRKRKKYCIKSHTSSCVIY